MKPLPYPPVSAFRNISPLRARAVILGAFAAILFALAGCASAPTPAAELAAAAEPPPQVLQGGDVVHIAFPSTPTLDTTQQIRRDGKLNLNLIGEIQAAGKTPAQLEKQLIAAYAPQLVSKEVNVTVVSSSFGVFVTGAVMKPGKIQPDHAITAFEAIMEAGGFDYEKANTKDVRVIRSHGDENQTFTLNMSAVLAGKPSKPFYLQNNDTVYVPQKLQLF